MRHSEFQLTGNDASLFTQLWQPEGEPKGVICLVHGIGEHSGRYADLVSALTRASFVVLSSDLRGHGKSSGKRGHIPAYSVLMDDLELLLNKGALLAPKQPLFLYGHSMGGNLVLNYALRRNPTLAGVIATGPWLKLAFAPSPVKVVLVRLMAKLYPSFTQSTGLDAKGLSHDLKVVAAYELDPRVHDQISARLFSACNSAGLWALKHASDFTLPLLLMHGKEDPVTSWQASTTFAQTAANCTLKIWDGMYHEIHNEPDKEEVFAYAIAWLKAHSSS
ncbi:MAG: lysophospholipase [Peptococcaceae bacterium]|nr:lysophospholipase [Peptococcaceae bacterium]